MNILKSTKFWIGIGFLGLLVALRYSGLGNYVTLEMVQAKRMQLELLVSTHYVWSVLIFLVWYIVIVILALPIVALSTIAAGFLFGVVPAVIYCNVGATCGATLFFLMVRYSLGDTLQARYKNKLVWFNEQMRRHGVYYLVFMRFFAMIPFFVENLLAGLSQVSAWTFAWTTSVGIIPGSFVYAFAGRQLTTVTSIRDVFTWKILLAFTLLALLAIMPVIVHRFRRVLGKES